MQMKGDGEMGRMERKNESVREIKADWPAHM